ncbi:DEHA2F03212p [Debaryomyces hansenii CBS767]|jgi:hypothetical protein|uniref:DEHA2F03212p n=1 Tax=Debaryomyces hansenii (strain ATCC 36239 / CBS 767 / BCRC 21394 / JCM 1990 / NBRC 0083 / IGC 2968) TaxID=284592 RepID=B5RU85_DEBHA|nr:DEHA2F03212p [Debaryomyces hansenii CBS767]CAR66262.1 DEHA2F03212p [Debaryomyces hansenii CBS767]|eukprot:XP_002770731.1 DEHA2F03212p [Debaryomyces hansenii CBS767]
MPDDKLNMAKSIGASIAGSVGGAKVADKLHLGNGGHMATSIAGSIGANNVLHHFEDKDGKK